MTENEQRLCLNNTRLVIWRRLHFIRDVASAKVLWTKMYRGRWKL